MSGTAVSGTAALRRLLARVVRMLRHPHRVSLTTKLVGVIVAILAAALLLFGATTVVVMRNNLSQRLDSEVQQAAMRALTYTRPSDHDEFDAGRNPIDAPGQPARAITLVADVTAGTAVGFYRSSDGAASALTSGDVQALADAGLLTPPRSYAEHPTSSGLVSTPRTVHLSIGEYRVLPVPVPEQNGHAYVLVAGLPTTSVEGPVAALALTELLGGLGALVVAGSIATIAVRRSLRPLERISQAATDVAALPLGSGAVDLAGQRVPADLARPGTEVGNVGHALNLMIDNVDDALSARARSEGQLRTFVADASHELRTPLAAVRGYTSMIRLTEDLSPEGRTSLGRVESQADRMTGLVEDLLMLARLDEGRTPTFSNLDLSELAVEAVMDASAAGPDHTFTCHVPEEPMTVRGDGRQLAQVFANLLSNARKHTPAGTRVSTTVRRSADGWVEAVVADNGPGIAPEFLPHLFDRFARADSSRTAKEGSTGLGLAIVQAVVQAHGGTVSCQSRPGRTVFTVRLPAAQGANRR
ncbi:sensor histidine kinase [Raineyella antarctica]|uniref:sensor histidine kinase n=1 Tax=Raineyella antarctica TaxID=1577474 RepID=UPI001C318FC6|nr:HAMP domain-containing sensor histidine kinase [Raineyella antarctica]